MVWNKNGTEKNQLIDMDKYTVKIIKYYIKRPYVFVLFCNTV
jgi:hypothetical protein